MPKLEILNLSNWDAIKEYSGNFDYVNHFESLAQPYFKKAKEMGASGEEAKEGLLQSILQTEPLVPIDEVNKCFEKNLKGYQKPDENKRKELEELHKKAAKVLVDYQYSAFEKTQQIKNRQAKVLVLNNPDLDPNEIDMIAEGSPEEFAKLVKATHEKVFTEENLQFLLKPRSAEEFIKDYEKLANLAGYLGECDSLNNALKGHIPAEEFEKYNTLAKSNMNILTAYRSYMGSKVDPIGAGVDFEQLETLPLSTLVEAYDSDTADSDDIDHETLNDWGGSDEKKIKVYNYFHNAVNYRSAKLNHAIKDKLGQDYSNDYVLKTMDNEEVDAVHALVLAQEKNEKYFYLQKKDDPEEKLPVMLTDRTKMKFAVAEDVPMLSSAELPKRPIPPDPVEEPKGLGLFARLLNAIKEFFTGKPTSAASWQFALESQYDAYCEDKELYDKELKDYNKMKKVHKMIKTAHEKAAEKNKAEKDEPAEKEPEGVQAASKGRAFVMKKLSAACKSLSENGGSGKDIKSEVLDVLAGKVLMEMDVNADEETFSKMKDKISTSDGFQKLADNPENLTKTFLEAYQPGNEGSILKVADVMGKMYEQASKKPVASQNEAPQKAESIKTEHKAARKLG